MLVTPETIARALGRGRERSNGHGGFLTYCPVHESSGQHNTPSLDIDWKNGQIVLICRSAGCSNSQIIAVLRDLGLWPENHSNGANHNGAGGHLNGTSPKPQLGPIVKTYDYRDEAGTIVHQTTRHDPKNFRQRRPDGQGGWIWSLKGVRTVLYRLPELLSHPGQLTIVCEGEKDADNLAALGFLATTNPMGAKNWKHEYDSYLSGRPIVILPDNDNDGEVLALTVARGLRKYVPSLKILRLPGLEKKSDVSDWLANGGTREKLLALIEHTPEWQEPAAEQNTTKRPEIILQAGMAPWNLDDAEKVLVKHAPNLAIFERDGMVTRVVSLEQQTTTHKILARPAGAIVLRPMSEIGLVDTFERLIDWKKYNSSGELKQSECPKKLAAMYLAREGQRRLPHLTGVIEAPILRPDGSILSRPGYDAATGLYLASTQDWSGILEHPDLNDALAAVDTLLAPFTEFPFTPQECRSVLLAAILTALQRRLLPSAPLFGFSAPVQRSGKSLLAESIGIIATGRKPSALMLPDKEEEVRKAITSVLLESDLITNIDNVVYPLNSKSLAVAITQEIYKDRLLGVNRNVMLSTNVMWMATGNNLCFRGELPSRSLLCYINAGKERPEERRFQIENLITFLLDHRATLVAAALTILRAYYLAGRPEQDIPTWGGFEAWSAEIRAPLVWLGLPDPYVTRELVIEDDPQREANGEVLKQWSAVVAGGIRLRDLITRSEQHSELKDALLAVAAARGTRDVSLERLGKWCRENKNRPIDGFRLLVTSGTGNNAKKWVVEHLPE